jgi:hypothetical protein
MKKGVVGFVEATSGRFSEMRPEAASTTGLKQAATLSTKLHNFWKCSKFCRHTGLPPMEGSGTDLRGSDFSLKNERGVIIFQL